MAKLRAKHIRFAESTRFLHRVGHSPKDPSRSLAKAQAERKARGLRARRKIPSKTVWSRFTTQLPWCTLYSSKWKTLSDFSKATTMWHELVHAAQWAAGYFPRYIFAQWRWALEVQAFRGEMRARFDMGQSEDGVLRRINQVVATIAKTYRLGRLNRKQVRWETRRILMLEVEARG